MEVYIDDMLVKSVNAKLHIAHRAESFQVLNNCNMKLNPTKCAFGVSTGKFLGFIVNSHFVSRSSDKCRPFFQVLKKAFHWDAQCQEAFSALKTYKSFPPVLVSPSERELLTLYLAVSDFSTRTTLVKERDRI